MRQRIYLIGAALGLVLPYAYFISFVLENGLDISLFLQQLFANRRGMRHLWVYVVCNLLVGVSLALPLFLFARKGATATQNRTRN